MISAAAFLRYSTSNTCPSASHLSSGSSSRLMLRVGGASCARRERPRPRSSSPVHMVPQTGPSAGHSPDGLEPREEEGPPLWPFHNKSCSMAKHNNLLYHLKWLALNVKSKMVEAFSWVPAPQSPRFVKQSCYFDVMCLWFVMADQHVTVWFVCFFFFSSVFYTGVSVLKVPQKPHPLLNISLLFSKKRTWESGGPERVTGKSTKISSSDYSAGPLAPISFILFFIIIILRSFAQSKCHSIFPYILKLLVLCHQRSAQTPTCCNGVTHRVHQVALLLRSPASAQSSEIIFTTFIIFSLLRKSNFTDGIRGK